MASKVSPNTVFNPVSALGVDKDGNYTVLRVDDVGRLQVGGQAQLFAYGSHILQGLSANNTEAKAYFLNGNQVTSGEVWVFTSISAFVTGGTWAYIGIYLYDGSANYALSILPNPSAYQTVTFHGHVPAINPQRVEAIGVSTATGGAFYLNIIGYKIKVLS